MRLLSVILLACIILLSSFGGMIKPAQPEMTDCCKKMAKTHCERQPKKKNADEGCNMPGCTMMLSCSICGFVISQPLTMQPPHVNLLQKPVAHYTTGDLAAYYPDNWKPPKNC